MSRERLRELIKRTKLNHRVEIVELRREKMSEEALEYALRLEVFSYSRTIFRLISEFIKAGGTWEEAWAVCKEE